jgi:tetratricopeptide (TPR) repeat protein
VVFEDLHWIDSETQALLDSLVEGIPTTRLLLLANYRPEYEQRWGNRTYYTQLRLDPLPPASADELLNVLLGSDPSLEPLKRLLIERTEGNPFFLEESVQTLVETEVLTGERGGYRLAKQAGNIRVPSTVQAMLAARIDRLPAEEKRLLATAAVIGKDVPFALLQAVSDQDESLLRQGLAHLQAMEFLYETALFPDVEYTFKHGLTHDVAYGTLLNEQRRQLHAQIAEAMQRLYADRLTEQVDRLAHHAFHGEQWERAVGYLRQAGTKAAARSAYPEASAYLVLASELQDQVRLGWASAYLSQYLWRMGDPRRAEEVGQRALSIACARGDFALEVVANFFLGQGYFNVGDYVRASEHCRRNVTVLEGEHAFERCGLTGLPSVLSRIWLAWSLAERGEFGEAMQYAKEALSVAETAGQAYSVAAACLSIGQVELVRGAVEQAIPALERSADLCQSSKLQVILTTTTAALSLTRALQGHVNEALAVLEESETHAPEIRIFNTSTATTALGAVYLLAGKIDEAGETAVRAAERAAKHGFRGSQARVSYLLGEICARCDLPDGQQAEEHYRQAINLAGKLGMRPLVAQCHLGLGMLYRQMKNARDAQTHLGQAVEQFREMDMPYWLKHAEAEPKSLTG